MRRGRVLSVLLAAATAFALSVVGGSSALAATGSGYGTWTVQGAPRAWTGTVTLPTGFSAVTFTSDSSATAIPTSAAQPATSSFGSVFGASTGQQYISLRPSGGAGTSSTTVYSFDAPTPVNTWGIALGDIDAESLTISATDAAGASVSAADLGFQVAENSGSGPDTLTATASATSYFVEDVQCPSQQARCNTEGATAWFRPAVALSTLTVVSTYKSGFPQYQTWFATLVRAISGTITVPPEVALTEPLMLTLTDSAGDVVATTTAAPDGSYLFDTLAARDDYAVAIDESTLPADVTASDPIDADTFAADVTDADFALQAGAVMVGELSGTVVDPEGQPVPDAEVTVSGDPASADPVEESTVTDEQGAFVVEDLPFGDYIVEVVPPAASGLSPSTVDVTVGADTDPVVFALTPVPPPVPDAEDPESPPPYGSVPGVGGELAATGADPAVGAAIGLVLLLAGATLAIRRRRPGASV